MLKLIRNVTTWVCEMEDAFGKIGILTAKIEAASASYYSS